MCFVAIWLVQLTILAYGMEMVRRYEAFAELASNQVSGKLVLVIDSSLT